MGRKRRRRVKQVFPLKALLQRAGWTQLQLAKSARLSMQSVNCIANGRTSPNWQTAAKIAGVLGMDLNELVAKGPMLYAKEDDNGRGKEDVA